MGRQNNESATLKLRVAGYSDKGRVRSNNEDSFLVEEVRQKHRGASALLCVVADGMGGQDYGEVASQTAIATFHRLAGNIHKAENAGSWLDYSARQAHAEVKRQHAGLNVSNGMGSTLVAGLFVNNRCFIANVGDSRAYLLRQGYINRQTRDHSLMEIMLAKNLIKPDEVYSHPRRGEITHYLGQDEEVKADIYEIVIQEGDALLFCSDGLWEMVRDPDMAAILNANTDPGQAAKKLIDAANQAGGADNVTAVVTRVI